MSCSLCVYDQFVSVSGHVDHLRHRGIVGMIQTIITLSMYVGTIEYLKHEVEVLKDRGEDTELRLAALERSEEDTKSRVKAGTLSPLFRSGHILYRAVETCICTSSISRCLHTVCVFDA